MVNLHLGSGDNIKSNYINIDLHSSLADLKHDLNFPLPFDKDSVDVIEGYHIFEHLNPLTIRRVVGSWVRCLKPGGLIILEMPDFDKVVEWYQHEGSELSLKWIFGIHDDAGQVHHWGWNEKRLRSLFETFHLIVTFEDPLDYHRFEGPCLRMVARKETR